VLARSKGRSRGYTLLELMITVAVIGIVAAASITYLGGFRRRVSLQSMMHEVDALMGEARLRAIENGRNNLVLFYPPTAARPGRIVHYEDAASTFFGAAVPNFGSLDPMAPVAGGSSVVVDTITMPSTANIGASGIAALPAPLATIAVNTACGFCAAGGDRRGAVVFDSRGRASFYSGVGAALVVNGGASISFVDSQSTARWLLVVTSGGGVQLINNG